MADHAVAHGQHPRARPADHLAPEPMVDLVAHPEPPAPGGVRADPEHLAQPVRLGGDRGPLVLPADRRGQGRRRGLGLAGDDPGEPGQLRPGRPGPVRPLRRPGASARRRARRGRRGSASRGRRGARPGGSGSVEAGSTARGRGSSTGRRDFEPFAGQGRPEPGAGQERERPAALGDVGVEPGPGLGGRSLGSTSPTTIRS